MWLHVGTDEVQLRATDLETGEAVETRPAAVSGSPCVVGLYLWGFLAVVRRLRGNELVIEIGQPDKPVTIYTAEYPSFRYHLLPVAVAPPPTRLDGR